MEMWDLDAGLGRGLKLNSLLYIENSTAPDPRTESILRFYSVKMVSLYVSVSPVCKVSRFLP